MTKTLYTITLTGEKEWWGAGIKIQGPVIRIGQNHLLIREGYTIEDIENPTIEVKKATAKVQKEFAEQIELALNPPSPEPATEESPSEESAVS